MKKPKKKQDNLPFSQCREIIISHWPEGAPARYGVDVAVAGSDAPENEWPHPDAINNAIDALLATTFIAGLKIWEIPHRFFNTPFGEIVLRAYVRANTREWISIKDARVILDTNSFTAVKSLVHTGTVRSIPNPWPPAWHKTSLLVNRADVIEAAHRKIKKE